LNAGESAPYYASHGFDLRNDFFGEAQNCLARSDSSSERQTKPNSQSRSTDPLLISFRSSKLQKGLVRRQIDIDDLSFDPSGAFEDLWRGQDADNPPSPLRFQFVGRTGSGSATTGIAQLIQKLFRSDQVGGSETLRKAVVDRLEAGDGVAGAALDRATSGPG